MNPFEQHGIKHLSASSINLFAAEPAMWVMQKLAKKSTGVGPAAHRGTASEAGIVMGLLDPEAPIVQCQQHALNEFDRLVSIDLDGKAAKERAAIMDIVEHGIKKLRVAGIPDEVQQRIEINLPGIAVPFIGYVDVGWRTKHGIRLDVKTKLRTVTAIEEPHNRQVSLYLYGTNMTGRVCYITPKGAEIFTLENPAQHVEQARQIALRIQNFLSLGTTEELIKSVVPNYGSFYWDAASRSTGKEVFGI